MMWSRLLILAGLLGAPAGYVLLGPEFSHRHGLAEQIAVGLLAVLMLCTLLGMKVTTILGFLVRAIVIAFLWRCVGMALRMVRLR